MLALGVDISKLKFDVALLGKNEKYKTKSNFDNNINGFKELLSWLRSKTKIKPHICMEATGIYGDELALFLFNAGYPVSVVNPSQIKAFGQSRLSRNKTDKSDAKLIALFCRLMEPRQWQPISDSRRKLKAYMTRIEDLQKMIVQEKNRSHVAKEEVLDNVLDMIKHLNLQIKKLKKEVTLIIKNDPILQHNYDLLIGINGIGEGSAVLFLATIDVNEFKNAKQLAAYIGITPKEKQSGSSVRGQTRMAKVGHAHLRKAMYFPALAARRCNPIVSKFCKNLEAKGKSKMASIGAAMRKLVHIVFGVLKNQIPFDPYYKPSMC